MSKNTHLRASHEFRQVYAHGKQYDGRLMAAFVLANNRGHHRLGITASRKATGNAVQRNRAKRLLREIFRLSGATLDSLELRYDWVFNAKSSLLRGGLAAPMGEIHEIIARVVQAERNYSAADQK